MRHHDVGDIVEEARTYAREQYPQSDWPHILEVVSYAHTLAQSVGADEEIVALAAYFHDISRATRGAKDHSLQSAAMAIDWLASSGYPPHRAGQVAEAIKAHMEPIQGPTAESLPVECQVLYDADKLGRARGMGLVGSLVQLGTAVSWETLTYASLATAIRKGMQGTEMAFRTLYTAQARDLAREDYERAMAFGGQILELEAFSEADYPS